MEAIRLELIFKENYRELCLLSYSYLGNPSEAEDVVQDVFIKLLQRKKEEPILNIKAYITNSVRNVCLKRIKKSFHTRAFLEDDEYMPSFEAELIKSETTNKIFAILETLPEQHKKVFKLCVLEGLKYKNAAQILGISTNTVKYHLKKSFKSLRFSLHQILSAVLIIALN